MKLNIEIDSKEDVIPHMSKGMPPSTGIIQDAIRQIGVWGIKLTQSAEGEATVYISPDFGEVAAMQYATLIKNALARRFGADNVKASLSTETQVP